MKNKEKWYCWRCGKPIGKKFFLWSMSDRTDRVFITHKGMCENGMNYGDIYILDVKATARAKKSSK